MRVHSVRTRRRTARHGLSALLFGAVVSLAGVALAAPADAQGRVAHPAAGNAVPAMHAKGRAVADTGNSQAQTWTPQVRPVNTLACTAGAARDTPTSAETGCDCGPARTPRVERVAGTNRYSTAAALVPAYRNEVSTVYVVNGDAFADAASGASAAAAGVVPDVWRGRAWAPAPLVLTRKDSLPAATRAVACSTNSAAKAICRLLAPAKPNAAGRSIG